MNADLVGAGTAVCIYATSIVIFTAPGLHRPPLYYVQTGLMTLFVLVTLAVDYLFVIDFRKEIRWVMPYVMLYFAGGGGMVGVASNAGRPWTAVCGALFIVSGALAFIQRAKTGF